MSEEIITRVERAEAAVGVMKDLLAQVEERMSSMGEVLGEIRSTSSGNEVDIREIVSKLSVIEETVRSVEPEKIMEALAKRDALIEQSTVKAETAEKGVNVLRDSFKGMEGKIDKIQGFQAMVEIHKEMGEMIKTYNDRKAEMERLATKVETTFFELDKRFRNFDDMDLIVRKTEDFTNELAKTLDSVSVKIDNVPSQKDLALAKEAFRSEVEGLKEGLTGKMEGLDEDFQDIKGSLEGVRIKVSTLSNTMKDIEEASKRSKTSSADLRKELMDEVGVLKEAVKELGITVDKIEDKGTSTKNLIDSISGEIEKLQAGIGRTSSKFDDISEKVSKMEVRLSGAEGFQERSNESVKIVAERFEGLKEDAEKAEKNMRAEVEQLESSADIKTSQVMEAYKKTEDNLNKLNGNIPAIIDSLSELTSILELAEKGGTADPSKIKGIKGNLLKIGKRLSK